MKDYGKYMRASQLLLEIHFKKQNIGKFLSVYIVWLAVVVKAKIRPRPLELVFVSGHSKRVKDHCDVQLHITVVVSLNEDLDILRVTVVSGAFDDDILEFSKTAPTTKHCGNGMECGTTVRFFATFDPSTEKIS